MKIDLTVLDKRLKSERVIWKFSRSPWISDVSFCEGLSGVNFLNPNELMSNPTEFTSIPEGKILVNVLIDSPVIFKENFFDLVANVVASQPDCLIYSDYFKPALKGSPLHQKLPSWSPERYLAIDYLGPVLISSSTSKTDANFLSRPRLILDNQSEIYRIPIPTYEAVLTSSSTSLISSHEKIIEEYLETERPNSELTAYSESGFLKISYSQMAKGKISIIIPTRGARLEASTESMVESCVKSILKQSREQLELEIVLVIDTDTDLDYISAIESLIPNDVSLRIVEFEPPFNFSRKCNDGASASVGDVLVFLNDDTEWINQDSLKELVATTLIPNVGVVGAQLLYPDGSIQHAGHVMSPPDVLHAYRYQRPHFGPQGDLKAAHEASGVTGACMGITREVFEKIGGWNEAFPNAFNDVDLCMTIRNQGYSVIQANQVQLIHHESKTRDVDVFTSHHRDLQQKWPQQLNSENYMRSPEALSEERKYLSSAGQVKVDLSGKYIQYFFYVLRNYGVKGLLQSVRRFVHKATRPNQNSSSNEIYL